MISIIVPCYNEEESLPIYYEEMKKIMKKMNYVKFELIFINDGSSDNTLNILFLVLICYFLLEHY